MTTHNRHALTDQSQALLSRQRVISLLRRAVQAKLTLLTAPGGYGKTTAVVDLARALPHVPFCWVRLDPVDAKLQLFLQALSRAVGSHLPSGGLGLPLGQSPAEPTEVREVARLAAGALSEHAEDDLIVVLDDLHHVDTSEPIRLFLDALLDHLPGNVHLIATSRTRPKLALGRLQARGDLVWLTARDLSFTAEEADRFFRDRLRVEFEEDVLAQLLARTEGWVAGLLLLGNLLKSMEKPDQTAFLTKFSGTSSLFGFLAEEVFQQQPKELREFLLATSVLTDLQPSVIERMLGIQGAGAILSELESRNLFTFLVEEHGTRYRYHHLFETFLRQHVVSTRGLEELHRLHRRAAHVYQAQGRLQEAMEHLLAAGEYAAAAPLLAELVDVYIKGFRQELVADWLRRFPPHLHDSHPDVLYARAQLAGWMAQNELLPALYQRCVELYDAGGDVYGLARTLSWITRRYFKLRQPHFWLNLQYLSMHTNAEISGYGYLLSTFSQISDGKWAEVITRLEHFLRTLPPASRLYFDCQESLALLTFWAGDYRACIRYGVAHAEGRSALGDFSWGIYNWVSFLFLGDRIGLEQYQKRFMAQEIAPAMVPLHETIGLLGQALSHLAHRRWEDQLAVLESLRPYFNDRESLFRCMGSEATYVAQAEMARALRRLGRPAEARPWLDRNIELTAGYPELVASASVDMADYLSEVGDFQEADLYLERARTAAPKGIRGVTYMIIGITAANLAWRRGDREGARRGLEEIVQLVRERECPFLLLHYGGPTLMPLLVGMGGDLVVQVLSLLGNEAGRYLAPVLAHPDPVVKQAAFALMETLSERGGRRQLHVFKVFTFGGLKVYRYDQPIETAEWKRTKVKLLLLVLLMRAGKPISKEALMALLWPETPPATARNNLRATIHGLRKVLEPDATSGSANRYVVADRETVSLRELEQFWFDLREFEDLVARGKTLLRDGKECDALKHLGLAVDFCKGPFLPELIFADHFADVRARTEQMLLDAALKAATLHLNANEHQEAIQYARRCLQADKTAEEAYQVLIKAHMMRGDRERAMQAYRMCCKHLRSLLGTEPSQQTHHMVKG